MRYPTNSFKTEKNIEWKTKYNKRNCVFYFYLISLHIFQLKFWTYNDCFRCSKFTNT